MKEVLLSKIVLEKIEKQQNKHATITQQHQQQSEEKREREREREEKRREEKRREEKRREKRRKSISIMSPIWKEPTSKSAFILSWFSVILTLIFATIGIVYYNLVGSALCLVFGLENCVDLFSSIVVLWRFYAPGHITKEREKVLKRRELRASMAISIILILLGFGVIATSSFDIAMGPVTNQVEMDIIIYIAGFSVFIFGALTIFKFHYAHALSSESLYKDGVCSLIGTILASALFVNTIIIKSRPEIWWLDPFVAMVCGFAALFIGIHSLYVSWKHKRVPICSLSWWMMSRGGSAANTNNNNNDNDDGSNNNNEPGMSPKASDLEMKESNSGGGLESTTNLSGEIV